jgi:hypothetical protein
MRNRTRLAIVGSVVVCLAAGCGSISATPGSAPRPGVITGTADMCSGPPGLPPHNVQVRILQGARVIAHQTYFGNHTFRFLVSPGRYIVTSDQSYVYPLNVTVSPGEEVHAEVYSACD